MANISLVEKCFGKICDAVSYTVIIEKLITLLTLIVHYFTHRKQQIW